MIDSLVKAIDKMVQLLEYRAKRKQLRYDAFIKPVYEAMLKVHQDYLQLFEGTITRMEKKESLGEVIAKFTTDRTTTEALRRDLRAKIGAFRRSIDEPVFVDFYVAVGNYLTVPDLEEDAEKAAGSHERDINIAMLRSSTFRALLHLRAAQAAIARGAILGESYEHTSAYAHITARAGLEGLLEVVREMWDAVARTHAEAQLHTAP